MLNSAAFVINYVIDMGASVMLPIVIAIISIAIGIKVGKAVRSGLMIGVGFVGMGLIVDMMNAEVGPAAQAMSERFGLSLSAVDVGWPGMSPITWASPIATVAIPVTAKLKEYPEVVFEGHSTDYQSAESLRDMVLDGICILKVGPSLTYAMREAVFALSMMEKELVPAEEQAYVIETLEHMMTDEPANWQKHYHGSLKELALARKYSFSDRARYYMGEEKVTAAIGKLFGNLRKYAIPMNMLHQYMPLQFDKVRTGTLQMDPKGLVLDAVLQFLYDYEYAAGYDTDARIMRASAGKQVS